MRKFTNWNFVSIFDSNLHIKIEISIQINSFNTVSCQSHTCVSTNSKDNYPIALQFFTNQNSFRSRHIFYFSFLHIFTDIILVFWILFRNAFFSRIFQSDQTWQAKFNYANNFGHLTLIHEDGYFLRFVLFSQDDRFENDDFFVCFTFNASGYKAIKKLHSVRYFKA